MLTWPHVRVCQSGARRWSGSAICGPLNVRMLMLTPLNFAQSAASWLAAGAAAADADAAGALAASDAGGADAGPDVATELLTGLGLGVCAAHAATTRTAHTSSATDLNRVTGS